MGAGEGSAEGTAMRLMRMCGGGVGGVRGRGVEDVGV